MCEMGVVAACQPYEVLTLSFVSGDSVDTEEVDKVLGSCLICHFSIDLPVYILVIEVPPFKELSFEVLELYLRRGTYSWEYARPLRMLMAASCIELFFILNYIDQYYQRCFTHSRKDINKTTEC